MRPPLIAVVAVTLLTVSTGVPAARSPRAEIQVGLCEPVESLQSKLELRPRGPGYETWLFDDASLSLLARGVRVRLRATAEGSELTVKVAAQDCQALPPGLVPRRQGKCEFDMYGDKLDGVVSLSRSLSAASTRELVAGRMPLSQALSEAQARYLREVVKAWPLPGDLRALGPIANRVYRSGARYDVDLSTLPSGNPYAEIGIKVQLSDVERERSALARHLETSGVKACADQQGQAPAKLRSLLEQR